MKNTPLIIVVSVVSSLLTVLAYSFFVYPGAISVKEQMPVHYANYNEPKNIESRVMFSAAPTDFTDAALAATPSVVHISAQKTRNGSFEDFWGRTPLEASSGSGVIISHEGYIVTNNHVIEDGNKYEVTLNDRRIFEARLLGKDASTDLALLKLEINEELPYMQFSDSDSSKVGEWVLAVGNPFNLNSTVTAGIISAKARNINILDGDYSIESFIQTDAAVNPGNSGGALVNTRGELVGINTAIITRSGRYEGYSFAVPSNLVQKVVKDLKDFGVVQRGFLGVMISDVTNEIAEQYNLRSLDGVYINQVNENGAASDAGLLEGDIITHINDVKVNSTPELQEQVARFRPGNRINVLFYRAGKERKGEIILKNKSNTTTLINNNEAEILDQLGFELRDLSRTEKTRLDKEGIIVVSITKGTKIDGTNMEPGFIITSVNSKKVTGLKFLLDELEASRSKILLEGYYESYSGEYFYEFYK